MIRTILSHNPSLRQILTEIDQLRGEDRQEALQKALGVSVSDVQRSVRISGGSSASLNPSGRGLGGNEDDVRALRQLAEAVESAVRGGKEGTLGLEWGD